VSTHDEAPRRPNPLAGLARAADRAIPNPILALPLLLLGLGLLAIAPARITGDTFFDLSAGRDIVQHGLPHVDRLMAFTTGREWQDQQWLAHLASYGTFQLGGLPLVALVDTACMLLALLTAMLAARALGGSPTWIAAVASPVMLLLVPSTARAQTFALPLFAALVWLLARDARAPDRRILLVFPLLVLWANLHGSVLLASALVGLHCAVAAGHALRARSARGLARPCALAVGAVLAPFASPYGPDLIRYYSATATSGAFHSMVTEWAGTTLRAWPAFFVFAAIVVVALLRPEITLTLFEKLCLGALLLAGLDTTRNIVWLPVAATVLLPRALTQWSPEAPSRSRLRPILMAFALAGAIGIGVLAATVTTAKLEHPWPDPEGRAIARAAAADPSLRVLTQEGYADWLLWTYPSLRGKIAFDIRFELLGASGLKDVVELEAAAGPNWNTPFAGYRLELWNRDLKPEVVSSLLAERGSRVLSHHGDIYAILRPPAGTRAPVVTS
jgi:hypothetical protein